MDLKTPLSPALSKSRLKSSFSARDLYPHSRSPSPSRPGPSSVTHKLTELLHSLIHRYVLSTNSLRNILLSLSVSFNILQSATTSTLNTIENQKYSEGYHENIPPRSSKEWRGVTFTNFKDGREPLPFNYIVSFVGFAFKYLSASYKAKFHGYNREKADAWNMIWY